jgi:hypothetical protein
VFATCASLQPLAAIIVSTVTILFSHWIRREIFHQFAREQYHNYSQARVLLKLQKTTLPHSYRAIISLDGKRNSNLFLALKL